MLQVDVEARCTAGEILSHPWVSVSTHIPGNERMCEASSIAPCYVVCTDTVVHSNSMAGKMSILMIKYHGRRWLIPECPTCLGDSPSLAGPQFTHLQSGGFTTMLFKGPSNDCALV